MRCLNKKERIARMNELAMNNTPYLFIINYEGTKAYVEPLKDIHPEEMMFCFGEQNNIPLHPSFCTDEVEWQFTSPDRRQYQKSFDWVQKNENMGNSYLVNLTCKVPVTTNLSLRDIFLRSKAPYRLWIKHQLVCFSPESFVRVERGIISSYPMKGTLSALLPEAEKRLMEDAKEAAEHATIVDLIRNDLSRVAEEVCVPRYRYVEKLETNCGPILQTSSEIQGKLQSFYLGHPGDMLEQLLPAGSITGAPKPKTMQIIQEAENYDRDFYTGVMGIWKDGNIDSAVMIRFIDEADGQFFYKAGGGITAKSDAEKEYNEVIEIVYVPLC